MTDELIEQLESSGVDYEIVECDPDLADTAQFCEAYGYSPADSASTILVIGKSDPPVFAACVVLATTRLDVNKVGRTRFGVKKASFASGGRRARPQSVGRAGDPDGDRCGRGGRPCARGRRMSTLVIPISRAKDAAVLVE